MATRRRNTSNNGPRRGPRDGSGPRGGTKACPVTRSKSKRPRRYACGGRSK